MEPFYERLSFLDTTFLAMEGPANPMHVGATLLFAEGGLGLGSGAIDIDRIRTLVGNRLSGVPRYRQRLEWIPIERHPVWVDDAHFDITYHVRHTALPKPGDEDQLRSLAASILSRRLEPAKPLWEIWVVEGLADGGFALVSKVHHCMVDGMGAVDLLNVILSPVASDDLGEATPMEVRPAPTRPQLLAEEIARRVRMPGDLMKSARHMMEESKELGEQLRRRLGAMTHSARSGWFSRASDSPLNNKIGPNRRIDFLVTGLDQTKAIKNSLGGTVNDAIIAAVAGAIRAFLIEDRDFDPSDLDFRAMVPVSTRDPATGEVEGNAVTMWLLRLPLGEDDPVERHRMVMEHTDYLKKTEQATGAALLTQSVSFTPATVLSVAARVAAATARPFNMTVTNVPGPQVPLFMLDAQLLKIFPMVPLWVNHGLGVALFSYDGSINWGIVSDWDTVPDIESFTKRLAESLEELAEAAG